MCCLLPLTRLLHLIRSDGTALFQERDPLHRAGQGSGFSSVFYTHGDSNRNGNRHASGITSPQQHPKSGEEYRNRQSYLEEFQREEGDIDTLLRSGRIEAIVHGLWEKMNSVSRDAQGSVQDVAALRSELTRVEGTIRDFAVTGSVETLGTVVEEQRLRLDSLILGNHVIIIYVILLIFSNRFHVHRARRYGIPTSRPSVGRNEGLPATSSNAPSYRATE